MEKVQKNYHAFVRRLEQNDLDEVVRIHRSVLGYSLHSRLGNEHISFMYQKMSENPESYVGVAFVDNQVVGVVSGAIDQENIKSLLLSSFNLKQWLNIIFRMILNPSLVYEWWKGNKISHPVVLDNKPVNAILTTIAIDQSFQGLGVGKRLVEALEAFFLQWNVQNYCLDTLINNKAARKFYKNLGFQEIEVRSDSVMLAKRLSR